VFGLFLCQLPSLVNSTFSTRTPMNLPEKRKQLKMAQNIFDALSFIILFLAENVSIIYQLTITGRKKPFSL